MSQPLAASAIQEAPVFHPSEDEWKNPIQYIQSIRPRAGYAGEHLMRLTRRIGNESDASGICKIVPPKSFQPPLAFDRETFKFRTRVQSLCKLEAIARVEREFMHDLRVKLFKVRELFDLTEMPHSVEV